MDNHIIDFAKIAWENPAQGVRYKKFIQDGQVLRLVEFSEGFAENEYCQKGHAGYVLEGSFSLDFNSRVESYKKGDIIFIPEGEADKHKSLIGPGEKVLLLLFELVK